MVKRTLIGIFFAASWLAASTEFAAAAEDTPEVPGETVSRGSSALVEERMADEFTGFAGSEENADALVKGLRTGSEITLTGGGSGAVTFSPETGGMGYGNVSITLALAQAELEKLGISEPTPEQIQVVLMGGQIEGVDGAVPGILQLRSSGLGWGQIAKQYDLNLGDVVSGVRSNRPSGPAGTAIEHGQQPAAKLERAERQVRAEKTARADRPMRVERPLRVERPERVQRPGR